MKDGLEDLVKPFDYQFPASAEEIQARLARIDPASYGRSRNFLNGAVTYLSPYITAGVISTKQVMLHILEKQPNWKESEKLLQELAWRDYWQQVWMVKGRAIDEDLKRPQPRAERNGVPRAIVEATTGIRAIDEGIRALYQTGYMHNHLRMYVAAICCNVARCHWLEPARWMYYHLLDGDWASNALSWQWVAGSNSIKTYVANQDNINIYCEDDQKGTFLDVDYSAFDGMDIPVVLKELAEIDLKSPLPETQAPEIHRRFPTCVYTIYNLDPKWKKECRANRILLLEPSVLKTYPVSQKRLDFAIAMAQQIEGMQVMVAEFSELHELLGESEVYFKEHPLNRSFTGQQEPRDRMFPVEGYYKSFFAFWKKYQKHLPAIGHS